MKTWLLCLLIAAAVVLGSPGLRAQPLGIALEEYSYPYPVQFLPLKDEGQDLRMAYMDVPASGKANGKTVLLLHGKNFFGAYWENTIRVLSGAGYRVIVPDQLGFGKSSKPDIHYSFQLLAKNTRDLLAALHVEHVAVVGHSMGGMLAVRFALLYPGLTTSLVLEDPIGLEDYSEKTPYVPTDELYQQELTVSAEELRKYQQAYYAEWKPAYDKYVQVQMRWRESGEFPRLARSAALTSQMIYEQPVCHAFHLLKTPTLLIIGKNDRTAIGKANVSPEVAATLGNYPELGRWTTNQIPGSRLLEIDHCGHIPHFEAPEIFHKALLDFLDQSTN